ncbi:MAG: Crp/Fnr family transcriptional regulator [Steroidobacterales bacterium]
MVSSTLHPGADNRLLAALPYSDRRRILTRCDTVELALADVLYAPWESLNCIYFPTSSFISLTMPTGDSRAFEVGLVGNEGMLGIALVLDGDISPERAVVQGAGSALRMDIESLRCELRRSEALRVELDRYVHIRMSQLAQSAICAHFHLLESRLARRLLMTQDRAGANTFTVTQEVLASKLGVRRVGVTKAASALQQRRLIHYSRGDITVLDRRGLMAASCRCYNADRESYDRIRGQ